MITRWRILGTFTTVAPMHVGSGEVTENELLFNEKNQTECDVQAVTKDHRGLPCVPGTAVKGVLRAWAERFYPGHPALDRVFGKRDAGAADAETGRAEFHTAVLPAGTRFAPDHPHVPYWNPESGTGIASSVSINRVTGEAERHKLFFHEFVPEGVTFQAEVTAAGLTAEEVALLLSVLELGAGHPTHPYQFGASGANGWGRVTWARSAVTTWDGKTAGVGFACCTTPATVPAVVAPTAAPPEHQSFALTLAFNGPFLVNDAGRTHREEDDKLPHFTPLRRAGGGVWLPASSFRGVLRSRAEFLWRSVTQADGLGPVERLFGTTSAASRLTVDEFAEAGRSADQHQDFVAIDRFTGGAADGAKFHARYADRRTFTTTLTLDTAGLRPEDRALFAAALGDVCAGRVGFGFGGARGYGAAVGTLDPAGERWREKALEHFPAATTPAAAEVRAVQLVRDVLDVELNPRGRPRRYLRSRRASGQTAPWQNLSEDLRNDDTLGAVDVEYEVERDHPVRVRRAGQPYTDPNPPQPAAAAPPAAPLPPTLPLRPGVFAHPYYFLRMADRKDFPAGGPLSDARPAGHDRLVPDRYSGRVRVKLTTRTPLLICDTDPRRVQRRPGDPDGHFTYVMRKDAHGRPVLAASSVRGMLRSAYEAVTNSRFGVFAGHDDRLGLRMATDEGLGLVPCRIAGGQIHLLPGTSRITGGKPGGPMYAAWLDSGRRLAGTGVEPGHRQHVCCWIELWQRTPWDRRQNRFRQDQRFEYWKVTAVAPHGQPLAPPDASHPRPPRDGENHHTPLDQPLRQVADGYVCRTGYNFDRKHDERVFFATVGLPPLALAEELTAAWGNLIRDYRTNQDLANGKPRPGALRTAGWSRHMTDDRELELGEGSLAYARLTDAGDVRELFPVMISRKLYPRSPRELLPKSLLPAVTVAELSPADRVFGWVNQGQTRDGDEPAHRSQVRVGPVECERADAIHIHPTDAPVTLAILGQPKPAQGRFYLGNRDGYAPPDGGTKEERGYRAGNRIRGPKVYPHHRRGLVAEHYKASGSKSNQNRSLAEWVKPDTEFTFDLNVLNLSEVELGALVWLLSLPDGHHLRLGLGKPLGFGSVRAEVTKSRVNTGAEWVKAMPAGEPPPASMEPAKAKFVESVTAANPALLKAFQVAAAGFADLPVHYPPPQLYRPGSADDEGGKHFQWFGANERSGQDRPGRRLSLPDLSAACDPALPNTPII